MKIVAYARSSLGSPPVIAQLERIRKWAAAQDVVIVGEYSDDQVSGDVWGKVERPKFHDAVDALAGADCFVVTKLDRAGRSLKGLIEFFDLIKLQRKGFIACEDGIDTRNEFGEIFFKLFSVFADWELNRIRERTKMGRERAKQQDILNGVPSRFGRMAKIKDAAPVLALRREGFSYSQIARKMGVSTATISGMVHKAGDPIKTSKVLLTEAQEQARRSG